MYMHTPLCTFYHHGNQLVKNTLLLTYREGDRIFRYIGQPEQTTSSSLYRWIWLKLKTFHLGVLRSSCTYSKRQQNQMKQMCISKGLVMIRISAHPLASSTALPELP